MAYKRKKIISFFCIYSALIASLAGFLFGYNTAIISGAIIFISKQMHLTIFQQELVVSTVLLGALLGSALGGIISDKFGRRFSLFVTAILYIFGGIFLYYAEGINTLIIGRLITGVGVGLASLIVPLYIAEITTSKLRGTMVSLNQFSVVTGILIAFIFNIQYEGNWREMFLFGSIIGIILFLLLFFIHETPSWLMTRGEETKAKKLLKLLRPNDKIDEIICETHNKKSKTLGNWHILLKKSVKLALVVGILMSVFQQATGINAVLYYAPKIFKSFDFAIGSAFLATIGLGAVNVVMTIVALWLIDRLGRKPLLLIGVGGMSLSLLILSISFFFNKVLNINIFSVVSLSLYIAFFAISLGPIAWLIISEIYPIGIRGRAMGIATFFNWLMNYLVSLTFLTLINSLGSGFVFLIYAIIGCLAFWFIIKMVPETKGKTFAEIQKFWDKYLKKS